VKEEKKCTSRKHKADDQGDVKRIALINSATARMNGTLIDPGNGAPLGDCMALCVCQLLAGV
jgi:hypothetical protein